MTPEKMMREIDEILDVPERKARVDAIVPLLHGKWELQLMLEICRADGLRFGACKKRLPNITNSVLTAALRNLEAWGLVSRVQFNEIPPHVEYAPTDKGRSLLPVCYEIIKWGAEHELGCEGEEHA